MRISEWPWLELGYTQPWRVNIETRDLVYVGAFPAHNESKAGASNGLVWTVGSANNQVYLCGRVPNVIEGIVVPIVSGTDVVANGTLVAVNDTNKLTLYQVPSDYPVTPIPVETPVDPVVPIPIPPYAPLAHPALVGGFFVGTYRYGGQNGCKDVFGNCAIVVGEAVAAQTLDPMTDGQVRYRIIDLAAIPTMAENATAWASVAAIYLSAEGAGVPEMSVRTQRTAARYLMDLYHVPYRPMIVYLTTDYDGLRRLALFDTAGVTWPGVQLYLNPGEGPNDLRRLAASVLPIFGTLPVVVIAQAYDRNGMYSGDLTELVPVYHEIATALGDRHMGTLAFSYKRKGGMLDHPPLHDHWTAFAAAFQRPA
jgi:hypothetical protein